MVKEWKKQQVEELKKLLKSSNVVGIIDLDMLPAAQLQKIKTALKQKIIIKVIKKTILERALAEEKQEKLKEKLGRMPAILFTQENPFKLYKLLKQNQSPSDAKENAETPMDIIIKAGPTDFTPGPIIGAFGKFKIKVKTEAGKISIIQDATILKKGERFTQEMCAFLKQMNIKPLKTGLRLASAYENGIIYLSNMLEIDENVFNTNLTKAVVHASNLAIEIAYATKENIILLLTKAHLGAKNLGTEAGITTKDLIAELIMKAHNQAIIIEKVKK